MEIANDAAPDKRLEIFTLRPFGYSAHLERG